MKMYLNYNNIYKAGTYATFPDEIHDEVDIILPEGCREVKMCDDTAAIEWPDGHITLSTEVFTEHRGDTAVPYVVDCSGQFPKKIYLKAKK